MDIAFIHPNSPQSEGTGATHSATEIIRALSELGHNVVPYCLSEPAQQLDYRYEVLDIDGFPYHSATNLNRTLRERSPELGQYDVVHSYLMRSIPAMDHIGQTTTAKTVVTLNAYGGVCPKNDLRYMDREQCTENGLARCLYCSLGTAGEHSTAGRAYEAVSRIGNLAHVLRVSPPDLAIDGYQALAGHVKDHYVSFGYPADRIEVIPNMLDERFCVEHRSEFSEPYKLLYVGLLSAHKGVLRLPTILNQLRTQTEFEFTLTVVGDGGDEDQLREAFAHRDLCDAVDLWGRIPYKKLPAVYADHDLFIYPGEWEEPFGRVFLESMAAGTPVVATDVGSVDEIVGDGGRVVQGSAESFRRSVTDLVKTNALPELSAAAKDRVGDFAIDQVVPRFETLYERL